MVCFFHHLNKLFHWRKRTMTAAALGNLTGEFIRKAGDTYLYVENAAKQKIVDLTKSPDSKLKVALDWFTPSRQEWIAKIIFGLGVLYNFKENKLAFVAGAGLGFFSSMGKVPSWLSFNTLEEGELLSMKAEEGFRIQKVMAFLAFLNWYLGDTLLDNMFFGAFSGLISGNCLYHSAKEKIDQKMADFLGTALGGKVQDIYDGAAQRIQDAFEKLFPKEQDL
jgi:hypothetical protein